MRLRKDPDRQAWTVEAQTDEEGAFLALVLDALVLKFPPNNPLGHDGPAIRSPDYKTFDRTTGPNPPDHKDAVLSRRRWTRPGGHRRDLVSTRPVGHTITR